ncbi:MAG: aminotransferase class I/II-fold pyridoxal phosphate-dependent enzyme [Beijerinckiaceae bacterium]
MRNSAVELAEYVDRRLRLAGANLVEKGNPYNLKWDEILAAHGGDPNSVLSFAHYDYLGLARDNRIATAAEQALKDFGPGVGASRLVGGDRSLHREFEAEMATFVGHEDCLSTVSGYGLNVSLIGHLLGSTDLVIYDDHSHNSVMTGVELTRATTLAFRHNDLDHLEYLLGRYRDNHKRVLIAVEGLYSMDGDLPDLPRLVDIKERSGAWLMLDEAHSIGVLGKNGRGLTEHFGVDPTSVEFIVGTLSKAFVSCGGFLCASRSVIHWMRHTLPGYVYSVGSPPAVVAASRAALGALRDEPWRIAKLQENSRLTLAGAAARGLETGRAAGLGIVPIMFSSKENAIRAFFALLERGIYIPPIVQRAVSNDSARLRMFLSSRMEAAEIERALDAIAEVAAEIGEPLRDTSNVAPIIPRRRSA